MLHMKVMDVLLTQELHSGNQRQEGEGAITLLTLRCRDIKCHIILAIKQVCFCIFLKNSYSSHVLLAVDWISGYKIKVHFQKFLNVHLPIYFFFGKLLRSFEISCHYLCTLKMLLGYASLLSSQPKKESQKTLQHHLLYAPAELEWGSDLVTAMEIGHTSYCVVTIH